MPRYVWTGPSPQLIASIGLEVEPGQEFETDEELNHPYIEFAEKAKGRPRRAAEKEAE